MYVVLQIIIVTFNTSSMSLRFDLSASDPASITKQYKMQVCFRAVIMGTVASYTRNREGPGTVMQCSVLN